MIRSVDEHNAQQAARAAQRRQKERTAPEAGADTPDEEIVNPGPDEPAEEDQA